MIDLKNKALVVPAPIEYSKGDLSRLKPDAPLITLLLTTMKMAVIISRILLGLLFVVFGLNGFLNFIPAPAPTGTAGQFMGALFVSKYLAAIFALQLTAGLLLLANRFVLLALTILAPILVNIVLFHVFMAPAGFAPAVMACALWAVLFVRERSAFASLWSAKGTA